MSQLNRAEWSDVHSTYGSLITTVSGDVSKSLKMRRGYEQAAPEEVEQEVYLRLAKHGMSVDALDALDSPEAWIRKTAQFAAYDLAERRVDGYRREGGRPRIETADYMAEGSWAWVLDDPTYSTRSAEEDFEAHLDEVNAVDTDARVRTMVLGLAESILGNIPSNLQRDSMRLVYLQGMDAVEAAERLGATTNSVRLAIKRARAIIGLDAEASLRAVRDAYFPGSITLRGARAGSPEAIVEALRDIDKGSAQLGTNVPPI